MGIVMHKATSSEQENGKQRRKIWKSRPSKAAKIQESKVEVDKEMVKSCPSQTNYYVSICYRKDEGDKCNVTIDCFPPEVLSHCMSFLSIQDIYKASQVCQKFCKAANDTLLWRFLCFRDLKITQKWVSSSWKEYYKLVRCISWDPENCCPNEFKFTEHNKTVCKTTSYGVATARANHTFGPNGRRYVFDVKINFRRPNFFYGIGFIDKDINFNFVKAAYPNMAGTDILDKKYDLQWFYWSDGNCWDILGSHPVNNITRKFVAKKGIERPKSSSETQQPSLAFYTNDVVGVVLDYTTPKPLLTFFLNGHKAHQFELPNQLELYLGIYFYNSSDSVTIVHCESDKYDKLL